MEQVYLAAEPKVTNIQLDVNENGGKNLNITRRFEFKNE